MSLSLHLDEKAFEPGAEVRGRVDWQTTGKRPESLLISLLWHTEGKGTEDIEIVDQIELEHPAAMGHHDFAFRLPDFPWSFSGTLVSLIWAIEVGLEPRGGIERVDFVAAPGGQEVTL
ncbi:MAG: hypothetical protein AAF657_07010 [Acidobacteriota bacterium]